jgi:hypothetical protein
MGPSDRRPGHYCGSTAKQLARGYLCSYFLRKNGLLRGK